MDSDSDSDTSVTLFKKCLICAEHTIDYVRYPRSRFCYPCFKEQINNKIKCPTEDCTEELFKYDLDKFKRCFTCNKNRSKKNSSNFGKCMFK